MTEYMLTLAFGLVIGWLGHGFYGRLNRSMKLTEENGAILVEEVAKLREELASLADSSQGDGS